MSGQSDRPMEGTLPEDARRTNRRGRRGLKFLVRLMLLCGCAYGIFTYLLGAGIVQGDSMAPSMPGGSFFLYIRTGMSLEAGDVVIADADGVTVLKRVVATAGDAIAFDEDTGSLKINGQAENDHSILGKTAKRSAAPMTVSKDSVYLLGDNREHSADSRDFGEVPLPSILGKVFFIARGI